jgi:hypothetical protein
MCKHTALTLLYKRSVSALSSKSAQALLPCNQPKLHSKQITAMSCANGRFLSVTAGNVIESAIKELKQLFKDIRTSMDLFKVANTDLMACTTITDLEARYFEAGTHVETAIAKLNKFHAFFDGMNLDALTTLARQSEIYRGLNNEQLKACVELQVEKAIRYGVNAQRYYDPQGRMTRMTRIVNQKILQTKMAASMRAKGKQPGERIPRMKNAASMAYLQNRKRKRDTKVRVRKLYGAAKRAK